MNEQPQAGNADPTTAARRDDDLAAGRAAIRRGDLVSALALFRAAADRYPQTPFARTEFGVTLLRLGRAEEAEAEFREALARSPGHAAALRGLGRVALFWCDVEAALARFDEALALGPDDPYSQTGRGDALRAAQKFDKAAAAYQAALAVSPEHSAAWGGLGHVYKAQRDWTAAGEAFRRAAESDPGNAEAQASLGNALCDLGAFSEAEAAFERALRLAPTQLNALLGRVRAAWLRGEGEAAQAALAAAERAHPKHPRVELAKKKLLNGVARFDWRADIAHARETLRAGNAPPEAQLEACARLVEYGLTGPLEAALTPLAAKSSRARRLQQSVRALARTELDWRRSSATPLDAADELDGFLEKPVEGAEVTAVVFAGREERLFLGLEMLHRVLRATGVNLVYLRDLERTRYFGGVLGLGTDFASTVEALRALLGRYGSRRTLAIGTCMGVAAALRYGLELGFDAALGLSPRLTPWDHGLTPEASAKLSGLKAIDPHFFDDISTEFAKAAKTPKTTLIYGADFAPDVADCLSMSGLPGVTLAGVQGYGEHNCLMYLLFAGLLAPVLTDFVARGEVAPEILARVRSGHAVRKMPQELKSMAGSAAPSMWF